MNGSEPRVSGVNFRWVLVGKERPLFSRKRSTLGARTVFQGAGIWMLPGPFLQDQDFHPLTGFRIASILISVTELEASYLGEHLLKVTQTSSGEVT